MSLALVAGVLLASPSPGAPAKSAGPQRPARVALPDSVIARLPHKDLTARSVLADWYSLDPGYRPAGKGPALKRAFLDQLIEKEAIALAANAEPFVMTDVESAQYLAARADIVRRGLYRRLVADSTVITDADRDTARARLAGSTAGQPVPAGTIETQALALAEDRRANEVNRRIRASLTPAWDDSATAQLARAYAALDPTLPDLSHPMSLRMPNRWPALAPTDTTRVLATSTAGPLTMGEFVRRFGQLNPFQTQLPVTAGAVQARGEQFLGQIWFDRESDRMGIAVDPGVTLALARRRESVALDHYYAHHVQARIDTSETVLRARFARTPERYSVPAHALVNSLSAGDSAGAGSIVAEFRAGAPWDTLCARHLAAGSDPASCSQPAPLPDTFADTALVAAVRALAPGEVVAHRFDAGDGSPGAWMVLRLAERIPNRLRTFEEARAFAARDAAAEQSESLLRAELVRLARALKVIRNEAALARLDFGPGR
ncbi:MAG: peptidylprolyl isomerase [Candidatus Eisenbacteria bacterium]